MQGAPDGTLCKTQDRPAQRSRLGAGLTDLGFDANRLLKDLDKLPYTDKDGNVSTPIAEKYTIIECATSVKS